MAFINHSPTRRVVLHVMAGPYAKPSNDKANCIINQMSGGFQEAKRKDEAQLIFGRDAKPLI
jgi:hypothetical protein